MGEDFSDMLSTVVQAVQASLDWSSSAEIRHAASQYLENVKSGDVRTLASISFALIKVEVPLVKPECFPEIRHYGFKMLQQLVRLRWEELSSEERKQFASMIVSMVCEVAKPHELWVLKSQAAALIAEVARRELSLWALLLSEVVSLSDQSPIHAEMVAMVLRWLPEDITVHNEDLEGDRRRELLRTLTLSLPEIFYHLCGLLHLYLELTVNAVKQNDMDAAKFNAATVIAALNAVNAYAEWAPISLLRGSGLLEECSQLLSYFEFRLNACEFFKLISSRRRPSDETVSDFELAMVFIFDVLIIAARDFLDHSAAGTISVDENEVDFVECICETMAALGCNNLQCIVGDEVKLSRYFQDMLGFLQHPKFSLHFQSLPLWLFLLRESSSISKTNEQADSSSRTSVGGASLNSGLIDKEKRGVANAMRDDLFEIILDVAFQRMLKKSLAVEPPLSNSLLEVWTDDFASVVEYSQYRPRLLELIRLTATQRPGIAASRICQRVERVINSCLLGQIPAQDLLVLLDGTQLALDTTISAIFDGGAKGIMSCPDLQHMLRSIFEGILHQLLSLSWTEPAQVEILGRHLDAFGPFLKHFPETLGRVINKLFELLNSLPIFQKGQSQDPKAVSISRTRLQICASFVRIARAADTSLLCFAEDIARMMSHLQSEGRLHRSEYNTLGEAFLVMASVSGSEQQQKILEWLLGPLTRQWCEMEWQNVYLTDPRGFLLLLTGGPKTFENEQMWSIFHTVTFFERALKRSGTKNSFHSASQESSALNANHIHPLASQLTWMLPPLLKLLRCIHSLWSHALAGDLPEEVRAALVITPAEQASLLGEVASKSKVIAGSEGSQAEVNRSQNTQSKEIEIRNWLKGVRDTGYNIIGLASGIGDHFYNCMDSGFTVIVLFENLEAMGFRHIRQLIHLVIIPLVKKCPVALWEAWLGKFLPRLLKHCHESLSASWTSLIVEGKAKVPDCCDISTLDLKAEVLGERLLRDLTREVCALLQALASPGANKNLPSTEQLGQVGRMESSHIIDTEKIAYESLIGFLFRHNDAASYALQICVKTFSWSDSEAVSKAVFFCGSILVYAVSMNNFELQSYVAKEIFGAAIQGLSLESNALIHADLVSLCREIFVHLSNSHLAPREVLQSQLGVTPEALSAFETALLKTSSVREQKQHMKSLLLSGGGNQLKALMVQKNMNVITNVSTARSSQRTGELRLEEGDTIGLAVINTTA